MRTLAHTVRRVTICAVLSVAGVLVASVASANPMVSTGAPPSLSGLAQSLRQKGPFSYTLRMSSTPSAVTTMHGVVSSPTRIQALPRDGWEEYIADGPDLYHRLLPAGSWEVVRGGGSMLAVNPDSLITATESATNVVPKVLGYEFQLPAAAATSIFGPSVSSGVLGKATVTDFGELGSLDFTTRRPSGQDIVVHLDIAGSGDTPPVAVPTNAIAVSAPGQSVIQTCSLLDSVSLSSLLTRSPAVGLKTSQAGNQNLCTVTDANGVPLATVSISSQPYTLAEFEKEIRDAPSNADGSRPVVNPVSVPGLGSRAEWESEFSTLFVLVGSREAAVYVRGFGDQLSVATVLARVLLPKLAV